MLRIIAKLEIKGPNLIKGLQFEGNRVLGHAQTFSHLYYHQGVDELLYQDVVASLYKRNGLTDVVQATSKSCFVPITVAGGIRSVDDVRLMLRNGADKVGINSAALARPNLITDIAKVFGSQCVVVIIESWFDGHNYWCWYDYGREQTKINVFEWSKRVEDLGAGEVVLCSINRDGLGIGFDTDLICNIVEKLSIPVLASGGAGSINDIVNLAQQAKPAGIVISSLFHYHYSNTNNVFFENSPESKLRLGDRIDSGNIEFLRNGYGGNRNIFVNPTSILKLKEGLKSHGIEVRDVGITNIEAAYE